MAVTGGRQRQRRNSGQAEGLRSAVDCHATSFHSQRSAGGPHRRPQAACSAFPGRLGALQAATDMMNSSPFNKMRIAATAPPLAALEA